MARAKVSDPWEEEWRRRYASRAQARLCEHPGCAAPGEHRAPKDRVSLNEYRWLCLEHVRAFNAAWNYFAGMSEGEVEAHIRRDIVWDRPTWKLGGQQGSQPGGPRQKSREDGKRGYKVHDDFGVYEENVGSQEDSRSQRADWPSRPSLSPESQAARTMELEFPVTWAEVRIRYRQLVKQHHPDANGGDKEAEERLKTINQAYATLRKFLC
ncbi:MAG: DnaJ domain-containing protein [Alphaproteobacteria bacterium]|nr:DnaJ domain-containing protein [Alphaproteobacteria bacterium]MBU0796732.1 DnaJ domain-containing protein [Alphaproteobacteria bacterium]MBU0889052.1 DnaJ domain-containing protein [Alphaproteobacteria bacterium]MBU1814072.1 DnaJ domain-containing protein [Alphaproteobacteria bacterium]MBU2091403.1 DnaJ domain-containing protein [Alphaproteobacteria bacterium]